MGIELSSPAGGELASHDDSIGKQIQRRAAYGRVTVESITTYLEALQECGIIVRAAMAANLSYSSILNLRKQDEAFAAEEERAKQLYIAEKIDKPIEKFGLIGEHKIIIDKFGTRHEGERIIHPQLALAYARKFDPSYREKQEVDMRHSGGVVVVSAPMETTEADIERYAEELESGPDIVGDSPALPAKGDGGKVSGSDNP